MYNTIKLALDCLETAMYHELEYAMHITLHIHPKINHIPSVFITLYEIDLGAMVLTLVKWSTLQI